MQSINPNKNIKQIIKNDINTEIELSTIPSLSFLDITLLCRFNFIVCNKHNTNAIN